MPPVNKYVKCLTEGMYRKMQRFTPQVKLYALDERHSGKTWKQVQQGIGEKFNTLPPSIRAMEKWAKEIDREKLSRLLIEESQKGRYLQLRRQLSSKWLRGLYLYCGEPVMPRKMWNWRAGSGFSPSLSAN